ncbi:hypothetical protein SPSIL_012530 [Sporomusa silvacetica DSM 10669]|uniref:Uncharacterized protein n=1 Tax=Sporomusa silvacetica DSM 10669 TaxID=1123289 RepID=A0ABZ3II85_9FIRM|nr:hypothetical protein SPSIL_32640 [Sporomusa silvacetica DSM 10669]
MGIQDGNEIEYSHSLTMTAICSPCLYIPPERILQSIHTL